MEKTVLEFGAWEPDQSPLSGALQEARNVIPAKRGYRPLPSLQVSGAVLASACRGAHAAKDLSGNPRTFAGTSGALYVVLGGAWSDRSKVGGYAVQADQNWEFATYGDITVAVQDDEIPQYSDMSGGSVGTFADITETRGADTYSAPKARRVGVVNNFVFVGALATQRNAVQWSGLDDPTWWPTPGTSQAQIAQSDINIFPAGGEVRGIIGGIGGVDGVIFCERSIYRAIYIGPPFIFQFDVIDRQRGAFAARSIVPVEGRAYYYAEDGFYVTDGASVQPIGVDRVDGWLRDNAATDRLAEIRGAADPINHLVVWSFATPAAAANVHDRVLVYHYTLNKWSYGVISTQWVWTDLGAQTTLEDLDALYGSLDAIPVSLDSAQFVGGAVLLGAIDDTGARASVTGQPLEAVLDTQESGGQRMLVHGFRPLVNGEATPTAALVSRDLQHAVQTVGASATPEAFDGIAYTTASTRYAAARVTVPAATSWRNALAVEMLYDLEGGL